MTEVITLVVSALIVAAWVAGTTALVAWLFSRRRAKEVILDPRFTHLAIHYSQRTDNPNTRNPARPRYVVNGKTKQAYWLSDLLEPYIKRRIFASHSHDGEKALRADFAQSGIDIHERDPFPEDLGIITDEYGAIYSTDSLAFGAGFAKLKGRNLRDHRIDCLYPWYFRGPLGFLMHRHLPDRRLLISLTKKKAFEPPSDDAALMAAKMLRPRKFRRRLRETVSDWSERNGYTFDPNANPDEELLRGA